MSPEHPWMALTLWAWGALLDCKQQKAVTKGRRLIVALEILADNALRTAGWLAVAMAASRPWAVWATGVLILEWMTQICVHVHKSWDCDHWKASRCRDPTFVRLFFKNQLQNPLGRLGVFGLVCADWVCYATAKGIDRHIPFFDYIAAIALVGRLLVAVIELRLCASFGNLVLERGRAKKDLAVKGLMDYYMDALSSHATKVL